MVMDFRVDANMRGGVGGGEKLKGNKPIANVKAATTEELNDRIKYLKIKKNMIQNTKKGLEQLKMIENEINQIEIEIKFRKIKKSNTYKEVTDPKNSTLAQALSRYNRK